MADTEHTLPGALPPTPPISAKSLLIQHHPHHVQQDYDHTMDVDGMSSEKFEQMFERKRKRRESHNVVERRRRENINARIDDLYALLEPQETKPSRGTILQLTVDYVRDMQAKHYDQQQRILELEAQLRQQI
ncbi:hypothetical protein DM01DRAFT_1333965 [Hesseltinella vesiculosa]|uniref:BHLH domain-containing protein n=1 Tax=Hesseltinella vesiculosa TaxID=101127 RepID=A0A1X2GPA4_9FUNG|nr:hypothetical protein DM01DRAFT_1333965 [Hesseltinella vesiculosa]